MMLPVVPRTRVRHYKWQFLHLAKLLAAGAPAGAREEFQRGVAEAAGCGFGTAFSSGRSALGALLSALDYPRGARILMSSLNYPAMPRTVAAAGYRVQWVPMGGKDLAPAFAELPAEALEDAVAVIWPHFYGIPANTEKILAFCREHGLDYIEDAAHAFGMRFGGKPAGSFGRAAIFSFETSKPVNTFGGGVVVTGDEALAVRLSAIHSSAATAPGGAFRGIRKSYIEAAVTSPWVFTLAVCPAVAGAKLKGEADFLEEGGGAPMPRPVEAMGQVQAAAGLKQMDEMRGVLPVMRKRCAEIFDVLRRAGLAVEMDDAAEPNGYMTAGIHPRPRELAASFFRRGVDIKLCYMKDCHTICEGEGADLCRPLESSLFHIPVAAELREGAFRKYLRLIESVVGRGHGDDPK